MTLEDKLGLLLETAYLFEPNNGRLDMSGLSAAHVLVNPLAGTIPIRVINASTVQVPVYPGMQIGTIIPIPTKQIFGAMGSKRPEKERAEGETEEEFAYLKEVDLSEAYLTEGQKRGFLEFLKGFPGLFSKGFRDVGYTTTVTHKMETEGPPIKQRPYKVPYALRDEARKEIDRLLEAKIIIPSKSPYSAPVVLVRKPDQSIRFCCDYRAINAVTKANSLPLKHINDMLSLFHGVQYLSVMDLSSGFWQVGMDKDSQEKTAFCCQDGTLYEWTRMPFGLKNSPATFCRLMEIVLSGLDFEICLCYVDDIIAWGKSVEDMTQNLKKIFGRLQKHGLKLKAKKCYFFRREVEFVGHIVGRDGIKVSPSKVEAVVNAKPPENKTELRSFLGLVNYYRKFVPGCANISNPLTKLTEENTPYQWSKECQKGFETLKEKLTHAPVLKMPDFNNEFLLAVDASGYAVGAVLSQKDEHGKEHPIAYASKTLSKPERNYPTCELEALALIFGVKHFYPFLYGKPFTLLSDHYPLTWLMNSKNLRGRLGRWAMLIQSLPIKIVYKKGKLHGNADGVSRLRSGETEDTVPTLCEDVFLPIYAMTLTELDREVLTQVADRQKDDPKWGPLIQYMETGELPEGNIDVETILATSRDYYLIGGTLYRIQYDRRNQKKYLLVVPDEVKEIVIRSCHDIPMAGHQGMVVTEERVRMRFWWKNLRKDVRDWVASCKSCATKKDPVVPVRAPLTSIAPLAKFQRWYTDCVGPLPLTEQGNKFFIIFVESITKYVEIFALPDLKAETTARVFVSGIVLRYGICKELYSDQGTNYTADLMRGIEDILGITPVFSSSFHPMSNGTAERTNRSIIQVMSQLVDTQKQRDWDLVIQYVAFALNTSISRTLRDSPHYLMYLADPVMPLDQVLDLPDERYYERDEYKVHMQILFSDAMEAARTSIEASQDRQKIYYDQKAHPHPFQVGELVWLHCPAIKKGLVKKLCHLWHGPYRILDLDNVKALIRPVNNRSAKPKVVHVNRLKVCADDVVCEFRRKGGDDYPANELNEEGSHNQPFRKRLKLDENAKPKRRGPKIKEIVTEPEPEPDLETEMEPEAVEDENEDRENVPEVEMEVEPIREVVDNRYPLRSKQTQV
jgi:hypothetical protein